MLSSSSVLSWRQNSAHFTFQVTRASLDPAASFIARPAASWLDDFLTWLSPNAFGCCRQFSDGAYCPPDDQPPCCPEGAFDCTQYTLCANCTTVRSQTMEKVRNPDEASGWPLFPTRFLLPGPRNTSARNQLYNIEAPRFLIPEIVRTTKRLSISKKLDLHTSKP